jgi:transcriptional regulator with XRE-family HTH domain
MRFRTRLRKSRLDSGLSQVEVAAILSLTDPTSVSRWERGERLPSAERLLELSALYHRLANELLFPIYVLARRRIFQKLRQKRAHERTT